MTKIAFIDRDGTVMREMPLSPLMMFHAGARSMRFTSARDCLAKLAFKGVAFVWNSRNLGFEDDRPKGRLHPMNGRHFDHGRAEHMALLRECGIEQEWLYTGHPEVIHRREWTKGEATMAWLKARNIPVEDTVAFDNSAEEMAGYPAARVIAVEASTGIMRHHITLALEQLGLTASSSQTERQTPPAL